MTTETMTLTTFLLARIAEDEVVAREVYDHDRWIVEEDGNGDAWVTEVDRADQHWRVALPGRESQAEHIARHDPARVLAECEARRRIVEGTTEFGKQWPRPTWIAPDADYAPERPYVLRCLAFPYADHPDYREEWKP